MPRWKRREYAVALDRDGRASTERSEPAAFGEEWTPEHLVLAALARCVVASLRHHARRDELEAAATAEASGPVHERDDGSWGFVELEVRLDVRLEPRPAAEALRNLLARAERGCFVGASLEPRPTYSWHVEGADGARVIR